MNTDRVATVGVFAESFGFGPASKATAIARALKQSGHFRLIAYANSIAKEYFLKEALCQVVDIDILQTPSDHEIDSIREEIDLAIVAVQPEWACKLQGHVPIIYVDSLGFMWDADFFDRYPKLRKVDAYIVQDIFGAASALRDRGVENVIPTGAIISQSDFHVGEKGANVAHLGGLLNIFSHADGIEYADFALNLIDGLVSDVLTSAAAASKLKKGSYTFQCLENAQALTRFASSDKVFTSPGLTALLELGRLGANVVGLPPQNYSQALIVSFIAAALPANPIWSFLRARYPVKRGMLEKEGAELVRFTNRHNAISPDFRREYRNLVETTSDLKLPSELCARVDGVSRCVDVAHDLLRMAGQ